MKRLTLEERVSRLENLLNRNTRKNEFFGSINKPKRSDESTWVSKLFMKYPSLKHTFNTNLNTISTSTEDKPFNLILLNRDTNNAISKILISTKGDRDNMYCVAYNKYGDEVGRLHKFHLDKELNKCAMFMLQLLSNDDINERKVYKFENVSLTAFDCEVIKQSVEDYLDDLPEIDIDVTDDNSDYGFVSVGLYNPEYLTSYDIIVKDTDSVEIDHDDKKVGTAKSIEDATELLADHFMGDYISGKYNKEKK